MKSLPMRLGRLAACLPLLALLPALAPGVAPTQTGKLNRLDPRADVADPDGVQELFQREFERDRWKERLTQPDLERREHCFDALLKRARFDPVARAFIEELAHDPARGELAWTARLGLRELGRASFMIQGVPGASPFGADPFGALQRMQATMRELFAREGLAWTVPPRELVLPGEPSVRSGRCLRIEQDPRGARVEISEGTGAEPRSRAYAGASLDEILLQNPELASELDGIELRVEPGSSLDLRLELGAVPREARSRRFPRGSERGLALVPEERSLPVLTDRLGVVVRAISEARARELGLAGVGLVVERTVPGTFAHLLGVEAGDVLLELDGTPLVSGDDIELLMRLRTPEAPLVLVWVDELGQRHKRVWRASQGESPR